jgi:hypothetical protein
MHNYSFTLENKSKKHICPACGEKRFVRYIDTNTGEYLPAQYGRCDREVNCAYHLNPYKDGFSRNKGEKSEKQFPNFSSKRKFCSNPNPVSGTISFIPHDFFKLSRTSYHHNNFVQYLTTIFDIEIVCHLISLYHIGTSKHWPGTTVFWQIDRQGNIRAGKIMLYNAVTGRRVKEPYNYITWTHKALKLPDFNISQCFFGEHLLKSQPNKPIALVESEKTAIIATVYLPQFIWLAVGSLSNLSSKKCKCLKNRKVFLFPDLNGFEKWSKKAKELSQLIPGTYFEVSTLLEHNAKDSDKYKGLDLADYLVNFDYRKFLS